MNSWIVEDTGIAGGRNEDSDTTYAEIQLPLGTEYKKPMPDTEGIVTAHGAFVTCTVANMNNDHFDEDLCAYDDVYMTWNIGVACGEDAISYGYLL